MLLIPCPWCGERSEREFAYGGDATVPHPDSRQEGDAAERSSLLYLRDNPRGWHQEYWFHRHGCRQWFVLRRHTVDHRIAGAAPPGEPLPMAIDP